MNIEPRPEKQPTNLKNLKFCIHTFGCQMNENDSERIGGILTQMGVQKSNSLENSNLIIINTCAVRQKSEKKLFSLLGRLSRMKKRKNLIIGVVGCVAQLHRAQLLNKNADVDFILGPDNYNVLAEVILKHLGEKFIATNWSREWKEIPSEYIIRKSNISAFVTIMEGCNNFCSYCIVPFTRGREKFRPFPKIIQEVKDLALKGFKEVQLLGQNVNSYQDSFSGKDFPSLLREVNRIPGIEWIRFITSHPKNFTPDIALAMKEGNKICHQLHLPIQSGSSSMLKRMNRGYTREEYLEKISLLRDLMPDISLSTDIIVGFPGETEKEFQETLKILSEIRYTNIFSFCYSPRPLTSASQMKDDVPVEIKKRRLLEVQDTQKNIQMDKNKSLIGQVIKTLCLGKSKKDPRTYSGRNEGFQVVNFKSRKNLIGKFVDVRITSCGPHSLQGEAINNF